MSPAFFDLHLAEHLVEDDLNVLVVDLHALRTVDVLHFRQQVLIQRFFALDAKNVVRNDRPAISGSPASTKSPAWTWSSLSCGTWCSLSMPASFLTLMVILPRRLSLQDFDVAGNFRQHGRILRLAGLEDFRDAGQTAGDVLRAGDFSGVLASSVPANTRLPSWTSMLAFSGK